MNAIELNHITKHYPSFTLEDISLDLPEGMILGLIGENGAGKTTLLRILLGITKPDGGDFSILGCTDPRQNKKIMERIGVVFDEGALPVLLTGRELGTMMSGIFENWDQELFLSMAEKLAMPLDTKYSELSRGNRMKAAILCAISHHPDLLVLDEATSGLDPIVRDDLLEFLLDYAKAENHTILMSSHIVTDLERACDMIAFLHRGKLLLTGDRDALKENYRIVTCTKEALASLDQRIIKGKRVSPYGCEVLIGLEDIPAGFESRPATIEEIFVLTVKGEENL